MVTRSTPTWCRELSLAAELLPFIIYWKFEDEYLFVMGSKDWLFPYVKISQVAIAGTQCCQTPLGLISLPHQITQLFPVSISIFTLIILFPLHAWAYIYICVSLVSPRGCALLKSNHLSKGFRPDLATNGPILAIHLIASSFIPFCSLFSLIVWLLTSLGSLGIRELRSPAVRFGRE